MREDYKKRLADIFMTQADQLNCTYEPYCASLKPIVNMSGKRQDAAIAEINNAEANQNTYCEKLGVNFEKSHPEVFKSGKLKKAKLMYREGKFELAMNTLAEGFNIESLNKHYNVKYQKQLLVKTMMNKMKEKRLASEESKKPLGSTIAHLKERVEDTQKKMAQEYFENAKLLPILREAYDLYAELEGKKEQAEKKIKAIQKAKVSMKETMNKQASTIVSADEDKKVLFKTIMCPLGDSCPKVKKSRWPNSSLKSVTNFGALCPYAHHFMELEFPESLVTKISASSQMIKKARVQAAENKPQKPFYPAKGKIWSLPREDELKIKANKAKLRKAL